MKGFCVPAFVLLLSLLSHAGFGKSPAGEDRHKVLSLEDPSYNRILVARVGDHRVSAQEFLMNYAFGPAFTRREKASKERYLDFMINEKLLALDGYARKLDQTEDARSSLAEIEGDLATEELYKADIRGKIKIRESTIRENMGKESTHLEVKWLFVQTSEELQSLREMLARGISFDSLFNRQLNDSVKADDRSMVTTRLRLELKNPPLSRVLDTMKSGGISPPIQVPDGFYIVKLADTWKDALLTQTAEAQLHQDVERVLVDEISDSLSDRYVQKLMTTQRPVIERKTFDLLEAYLAKEILPPDQFVRWNLADRLLQRWGPVNNAGRGSFERSPLVNLMGNRQMSAGEFLNWYRARSYTVKLETHSPEAFFSSLEQLVWRMVRDRLLVQRALARGFQKGESVRRQVQWWKDKIVYKLVRAAIADSIRWNDTLLSKYYADHPHLYRSDTGSRKSFNEVKEDVTRDYYASELTRRLLHRILALKQRFPVSVNERNLRNLHLEDEQDARAIDVYMVKKGGTFPRPAFPSIDYEWQQWE